MRGCRGWDVEESDLWRFDWIVLGEDEDEPVDLVGIERIAVCRLISGT